MAKTLLSLYPKLLRFHVPKCIDVVYLFQNLSEVPLTRYRVISLLGTMKSVENDPGIDSS